VGERFEVDYEPWWPFTTLAGDIVTEYDMVSKEVIWEWRLRDYVDPIEHHHESIEVVGGDGSRDWSHANTTQFVSDYVFDGNTYDVIVFNARHLNTFWVIDHATGDILWSCGEHGMFGIPGPGEELLFSHAHQVELLSNGNVIMYDNGNDRVPTYSRALELSVDPVAGVVEEAWSYTDPEMDDWWGGDANRLPNNNVLIVNVDKGRIIEVTDSGEIVWEMLMRYPIGVSHSIYMCQRVPYE
jgi:outer membrane protein assembly factor BamB